MDFVNLVKQHQEDMISDLQGLLRIPSLKAEASKNAPFGLELRKALDYVLELAKKDGFNTKDFEGYAGQIEFGEGKEILGVLGHLDVVPVGTGWSFDPFGASIKDGYIMARGAQDDKGPTMAAYYAMKILKEAGFKPQKRVHLIVGCDEESGMECMDYYNKHAEIPNFGFVPDADFPVIYGEKGILNLYLKGQVNTVIDYISAGERPNICIGEASMRVKGPVEKEAFQFYQETQHISGHYTEENGYTTYFLKGKYAHGSRPDEGVNAAWHLLNFVGSAYCDAFAKSTAKLLKDWRGESLGIKIFGSHMGYLTLNIGVVKIENGNVSIVLDIRYPQETNEEEIMTKISKALEAEKSSLKLELIQFKGPLFVNPKSTLVSTLETIYRDYSKDMDTPLMTMGGGTYARSFDNFVAFGAEFPKRERPSWVGQVHQADEGYEIEQFLMATAIYAQAIYDLSK